MLTASQGHGSRLGNLSPSQIEHKRAMDRKAQRIRRAKIKDYIRSLEREIFELQTYHKDTALVQQLLHRNDVLEQQLRRLEMTHLRPRAGDGIQYDAPASSVRQEQAYMVPRNFAMCLDCLPAPCVGLAPMPAVYSLDPQTQSTTPEKGYHTTAAAAAAAAAYSPDDYVCHDRPGPLGSAVGDMHASNAYNAGTDFFVCKPQP